MVVVLDNQENILQFLDTELSEIHLTDEYQGYETLKLSHKLTNVKRDKQLFKQGNKIFVDNCLFVINSECTFDYIDKSIDVDAEEIIVELNNCKPFYIRDPNYASHVNGNTIIISKLFLNKLLKGFFNVTKTDIDSIDYSKRLINVQGSITKYNLLKAIEKQSGLVFKTNYSLKNNNIIKEIQLLKPANYGVTHNKIVESVVIGENTNELSYSSDETKNALGIMPVISSENTDEVDYSKILRQFYNLDVNNNIPQTLFEYDFYIQDIIDCAEKLLILLDVQKYFPNKFEISHSEIYEDSSKNKVYNVKIGMGQMILLLAEAIINTEDNNSENISLKIVDCADLPSHSHIDCIIKQDEIIQLARIIKSYCITQTKAPNSLSITGGRLSFQYLIYVLAKYLTTKKDVFFNSNELKIIDTVSLTFVQENIHYIKDYENYEYMPFMYTQNTTSSNKIPTITPRQIPGCTILDVEKYISESYPILKIKKIKGASTLGIEITNQGIADDNPNTSMIYFQQPNLIQDESEITIDYKNKSIKFMKYVEKEVEKQVTENVTTGDPNTITVNMMPSCGCCAGTAYKRYTKTWKNYCPNCGKTGTLTDNPKKVYEGEITCSMKKGGCDADYCGYCGGDKWGHGKCKKVKLTPGEAETTTTATKTVKEKVGEYKEITAEYTGDESDSKQNIVNVITKQSKFNYWYGNVTFKLKGCDFVSLTCDTTKLFEFSRFPYVKPRGELYIHALPTLVDFNYLTVCDGNPKLEPFETSEQSVEEVLIGCWQKLNGSGDNTKWLEKNESIKVDLVETPGHNYNVGDFVYVRFPDSEVFKAQITEISYNPYLNGDKEIKIGNVKRESVI